jgi:hypothetical protein
MSMSPEVWDGDALGARSWPDAGWIRDGIDPWKTMVLDLPQSMATNVAQLVPVFGFSLRNDPASLVSAQYVTRDVTMRDIMILAESKMVLLNGSARRDERRYQDLDIVNMHRKTRCRSSSATGSTVASPPRWHLENRSGWGDAKRWPEWAVDLGGRQVLSMITSPRLPAVAVRRRLKA